MSYAFPRLRQQLANWLLPDVFNPVINMSRRRDLKFILQYAKLFLLVRDGLHSLKIILCGFFKLVNCNLLRLLLSLWCFSQVEKRLCNLCSKSR